MERLIRSAAEALDHAHARGVVHRDLKSANIMLLSVNAPIDRAQPLPQDVQTMITDFGLARRWAPPAPRPSQLDRATRGEGAVGSRP